MSLAYLKTIEKTYYTPLKKIVFKEKIPILPAGGHFEFMQIMQIAQGCQGGINRFQKLEALKISKMK